MDTTEIKKKKIEGILGSLSKEGKSRFSNALIDCINLKNLKTRC
jgi:hypothetical protein